MNKVKTTWPTKIDKEKIIERDQVCIYCGKKMSYGKESPRTDWATVEHLNHRSEWDSVGSYIKEGRDVTEIIDMCCWSCNASRGVLPLHQWFDKQYCIERDITIHTVAQVVRNYLENYR